MIGSLARRLRAALSDRRGAALAEYALLLAVVAVVLVGAMGRLSAKLESKVNRVIQSIK